MTISSNSSGLRPGVCTSTTRPQAPFEGQMIYETDTDMVAIWNGTAWRYIAATTPTSGTVLQVVYGATNVPVGNGTASYVDTGLTATITPKSSSSKILVTAFINGGDKNNLNGANALAVQLVRGTTSLGEITRSAGYNATGNNVRVATIAASILDSPSTTSATIYKAQFRNNFNGSGVTVQINNELSTITLMEIAG
jgi:hypothetical protein